MYANQYRQVAEAIGATCVAVFWGTCSAFTGTDKAFNAFKKAEKALDKMANKKVIHANKASRTKSRLSKKIKSL